MLFLCHNRPGPNPGSIPVETPKRASLAKRKCRKNLDLIGLAGEALRRTAAGPFLWETLLGGKGTVAL